MIWSGNEAPVLRRLKIGAVLLGLAWAMGSALAACALMFAWVVLSTGPVYGFSVFVIVSSIIGAILGGAVCGKAAGTLGLLHGFLSGLFYGLLLTTLFLAGSTESFTVRELFLRVVSLGVAGSIGGLFGVNLHDRRKARPLKNTSGT